MCHQAWKEEVESVLIHVINKNYISLTFITPTSSDVIRADKCRLTQVNDTSQMRVESIIASSFKIMITDYSEL